MTNEIKIKQVIGKTITSFDINFNKKDLIFTFSEKETLSLFHTQECCEDVEIDDISGDLNDLIGHPLIDASERISGNIDSDSGTETWTFYHFATIQGSVTIRWVGRSNGYYSEKVEWVYKDASNCIEGARTLKKEYENLERDMKLLNAKHDDKDKLIESLYQKIRTLYVLNDTITKDFNTLHGLAIQIKANISKI